MRIEKIGNQTLILGDCLEYMKQVLDNQFDLVLTDPPYGIDYGGKLKGKGDGLGGADKNGWRGYGAPSWDEQRPDPTYFENIRRVGKSQIIWGGNYFADLLPPSRCWLIWDKGQRDFSLADAELAWTSFDRNTKVYNISRAAANKQLRFHPTQKPLSLFIKILEKFASKDSIIFDPFMGSGTTLEACHILGLRGVGVERESVYFDGAVKRLRSAARQIILFK